MSHLLNTAAHLRSYVLSLQPLLLLLLLAVLLPFFCCELSKIVGQR
jgi:hypothetical protein